MTPQICAWAGFSIQQADDAFTSTPSSLGESIFCLMGHKTGLDLGPPASITAANLPTPPSHSCLSVAAVEAETDNAGSGL